ncbi:hypothetical protein TELCIR_11159 [Teladorsagia circumcincta]|uniref:Band 7 domain-containing protein n=1 Tax=Teladorsagia circumcincta TaxID=45464 RepID=A0A2G9UCB3_TELCI|nr:hypothetical protein TELCIR_11159 [Teladorsagia circumcincta]
MPFSLLFAMKGSAGKGRARRFQIFAVFVSTSEKLVVLRLGRAQKTRGPGATLIVPCIDTTYKISTTITAFNVPPLQVITLDRGLVELGATVFLRIRDPVSAVCSIQDELGSFTATYGVEITDVEFSDVKVIKVCHPLIKVEDSG